MCRSAGLFVFAARARASVCSTGRPDDVILGRAAVPTARAACSLAFAASWGPGFNWAESLRNHRDCDDGANTAC
eukprot:7994605-Alexandrium_andersonii.AAC.1